MAPKSTTYREYKCHPSEQFESFIWCQRRRTEKSKFGEFTSVNSILHSRLVRRHMYRDTSIRRTSGLGTSSGRSSAYHNASAPAAHFAIAAAAGEPHRG